MSKPLRRRQILHVSSGGTISTSSVQRGRRKSRASMERIMAQMDAAPFIDVHHKDIRMSEDSANMARTQLITITEYMIRNGLNYHGAVIDTGTDTMNLIAPTLALGANELVTIPWVLNGAIDSVDVPGGDALTNATTAINFAGHGNGSGVFAVRPHGKIITFRHDTPGGAINWHGIGVYRTDRNHFAELDLERLATILPEFIGRSKVHTTMQDLWSYDKYNWEISGLDDYDQILVGGRGLLPNFGIVGYGKGNIRSLFESLKFDNPEDVKREVLNLVDRLSEEGKSVGQIMAVFSLIEILKRQWHKKVSKVSKMKPSHMWRDVMLSYLTVDLHVQPEVAQEIVYFWKRNSNVANNHYDFNRLDIIDVRKDPLLALDQIQKSPPRGVIMHAVGASGMRLNPRHNETFRPMLEDLKRDGIPVVLVSSSRGEVTSFQYPPSLYLLNHDLVFYGGTFDEDLVLPRLARLNHPSARRFKDDLLFCLPVYHYARAEISRNMDRQLISGAHYRHKALGETTDRDRIEQMYGLESRIDALSPLTAPKAQLLALLHEMEKRDLPINEDLATVLRRY